MHSKLDRCPVCGRKLIIEATTIIEQITCEPMGCVTVYCPGRGNDCIDTVYSQTYSKSNFRDAGFDVDGTTILPHIRTMVNICSEFFTQKWFETAISSAKLDIKRTFYVATEDELSQFLKE